MAQLAQIFTEVAPLHDSMNNRLSLASELLFGEVVEILEDNGESVKVRNARDSYEGYIQASCLSDTVMQPTHKVTSLHSLAYSAPDFKTIPLMPLPFMALVCATEEEENGFVQLSNGIWLWKDSLQPLDVAQKDYVATAEKFLGLPYLWGGRTDRGLDCSALVQLAFLHAGMDCPRDSKDQIEAFKTEIDFGNAYAPENLQRGDIVFLEGHIGFMMDDKRFLNATSRRMSVCIENIHDAANAYNGGVLAVKRPAP